MGNADQFHKKVFYQRILVNQTLSANGYTSIAINAGRGVKSVTAVFRANALVLVQIVSTTEDGIINLNGSPFAMSSPSAGGQNGHVTYAELGGVSQFCILVTEKSGGANTINFVDVYYTKE